MGKVAIFSGDFAKTLKQNLNLFDQAYILTGSIDPSAVATDGPPGSLFLRSTGQVYIKQDAGTTTNWTLNDTSANSFVQGGNSFGTTALFGTNDTQRLDIETNAQVRATFDTSGNLGIGISTSILAPVHVLRDSAMLLQGATGTPAVSALTAAGLARPMLSIVNRNANGWHGGLHVYSGGTNSGIFTSSPAITLGSISVGGVPANASSLYTPTHTTASTFEQNTGAFVWRSDSGLTVGTNATPTERMRLTLAGNLSIGPTTAVSALHINTTSAAAIESRYTNSATGQTNTDGFTVGINSSGVAQINQLENLDLTLATNNTVGLTLSNAQNVSMLAEKTFSFGANAALQDNISSNRLIIGGTYPNLNFRTGGTLRAIITSTAEFGVGSSGTPTSLLQVNGSYSRATWTTVGANFSTAASTLTDTTGTGTIATRYANSFGTATLASSSAVTLTAASNLAVFYPQAGTNTTITTGVALDIAASALTATNAIGIRINSATSATNIYGLCVVTPGTFSGLGTTAPTSQLQLTGNITTVSPSANVGAYRLLVTGGTLTSSDATGTLSATAGSNFTGPTFAATNTGVTITSGATLLLGTYPQAGTNVTLTNAVGLRIIAGSTNATNGYGLSVAASTGATNNYCAQFTGGNVGIGIAAPTNLLHIAGAAAAAYTQYSNTASGNTSTDGFHVGIDSSGNAEIRQRENLDLNIFTNNTQVAQFSEAGNFGLGVNPISARLHIVSGAQAPMFVSSDSFFYTTFDTTGNSGRGGFQLTQRDAGGVSYSAFVTNTAVSGLEFQSTSTGNIEFGVSASAAGGALIKRMTILNGGNVGIGQATPTAVLHLKAGTATASTAPLKIASGTLMTTPEAGAIENNGTSLFYTNSGGTRSALLSVSTKPTFTKYTSGSGTYTVPTGVSWIRVKMVGGGGGGSGSGTASGGTGGTGGNTTFGTSFLTANGGTGGAWAANGGTGGAVTVNAGAAGDSSFSGANGNGPGASASTGGLSGGSGGGTPFGGAGGGGSAGGGTGVSASANTGSGGGGGGGSTAIPSGSGGGAGGYIEATITSPGASYSYAVGAAGAAGIAGTSGSAGGSGAAGIIFIEEYYI